MPCKVDRSETKSIDVFSSTYFCENQWKCYDVLEFQRKLSKETFKDWREKRPLTTHLSTHIMIEIDSFSCALMRCQKIRWQKRCSSRESSYINNNHPKLDRNGMVGIIYNL